MGHAYITASKALVLADSNSRTAKINLTSLIVTPLSEAAICAHVTLWNATAATSDTEILDIRCGTAPRTIVWSDSNGIEVEGSVLFITCASAYATLVWS
jgi:hypothetical protein